MLLEDADVDDAGSAQVEAWHAREAGGSRSWTVAPSFTPWRGVELGLARSRDTTDRTDTTELQAKFGLPGRRPDGACRHAVVIGASHTGGERGATYLVNGAASCDAGPGTLHLNLGASRGRSGPTLPGAGVAWEHALGATTAHAEWLVQRHAKPTANLGLRREIAEGLQIDGSVGRSGGTTLFSLGLAYGF